MKRRRLFGSWLVVAVLFVATLVLVGGFFYQMSDVRTVMVATRGLLAGTRLTEQDVATKTIHASAVLPAAVDKPEKVIGQLLSVPRLAGDQITEDMIGDQAISGIAATLPPDHRAIAVKVNQETGLAGVLRPGDHVTVIVIVDASDLQESLGLAGQPAAAAVVPVRPTTGSTRTVAAPAVAPSGPAANPRVISRIVLHDLKVLLVPQGFRYEEVPTDSTGDLAAAPMRTTQQAQATSVVVLDVPLTPVAIGGSASVSPTLVSAPELLALVNSRGTIHLLLQPTDRTIIETPGLSILNLIIDLLGWTRKEGR